MVSQHCNYCGSSNYTTVVSGIRDWEYGVEGCYDYRECLTCRGVQLHPFPQLEDLKRAYDIDYHGYANKEKRGWLFALLYGAKEWLFRRGMKPYVDADSVVLDVGCGAGDFLLGLRGLGVQQLQGIDFNDALMVSLATQGIECFGGTFEDFPAENDRFSVVAMNNYLEHTLEPVSELCKSYQILKSDGYLVGEVPGFNSFDRKLFGKFWGGNHVPRHTYQFSSEFLRRCLSEAGFVDVEIRQQLNTSHWALSVQNVMQRKVVDLRNNPALRNGRSRCYLLLVLLFIPLNVFSVLLQQSGCIKFYARKPTPTVGV